MNALHDVLAHATRRIKDEMQTFPILRDRTACRDRLCAPIALAARCVAAMSMKRPLATHKQGATRFPSEVLHRRRGSLDRDSSGP